MISVVVPVYNGEKTIKKIVDAILNNTFTDFELILVNDGSNDNTQQVFEEFAKKDKRIKVISQENKGLSGARNTGIDASKGEYICFIDADDTIEKTYFEDLYKYIDTNHLDWVEAARYVESGKQKTVQSFFNEDKIYRDEDIKKNVLNHSFYSKDAIIWLHSTSAWGSIYRISAIGNLRFREDIKYAEDIVFNYDFVHNIQGYGFLSKPLYHYLTDNSVISTKYRPNFIEEIIVLLETISDIRNKYKDKLSNEELVHATKSFIGIFFMHIFPNFTKQERKTKYHKLDESLKREKIREIYDAIKPSITDNVVMKIVIFLFKHKQYESIYYMWIIRNLRNKLFGS